MSYTENALVIHRVGGLEVAGIAERLNKIVIHRVGGFRSGSTGLMQT